MTYNDGVAAHAHLVMLELYDEMGAKKYGSEPSEAFLRLFGRLMPDQINRILSHCREFLDKGVPWPPSLGILQGLANKPTEQEVDVILSNIKNNTLSSDIERYITSKCAYELRRSTLDKQQQLIIKYYREATQIGAKNLNAMFNRAQVECKRDLPFSDKRCGGEFELFVAKIKKRVGV